MLALTYAIALADFSHVVAVAADTFLLLFDGQIGVGQAFGGLVLPAPAGNTIGGTGLFALLAYAQVREYLRAVRSTEHPRSARVGDAVVQLCEGSPGRPAGPPEGAFVIAEGR